MNIMTDVAGAVRAAVLSILLCCVAYTLVIWAVAQILVPDTANGSLVKMLPESMSAPPGCAAFTQDKYFTAVRLRWLQWCGAAGSNLTRLLPELRNGRRKS